MTAPIVTPIHDQFVFATGPDYIFIDWDLGNTCNFSCSYCDPAVHDGTVPWANINKIDNLVLQIKDNYKLKDFRLYNLLGGEPTAWPKLSQFIKKIKTLDSDTVIRIHTNGSRTPRYWKENCQYMDEVLISCHPESINVETTCKNINILVEHNIAVSVMVAMYTELWDKCIEIANYLNANCNVPVSMKPLQKKLGYPERMSYSGKQESIMTNWNYNIKYTNNNFISRTMKWKSSTTNEEILVKNVNQLIVDKTNHWRDWNCYIGLDSLFIRSNGDIKVGSDCNPDYIIGNYTKPSEISWPTKPIRCAYYSCFCGADMATRKLK
jgi:organic radical activating enzyme